MYKYKNMYVYKFQEIQCTIQKQTNLQIWFLSIYILDVHYIKQMHIQKLHYELHTNTQNHIYIYEYTPTFGWFLW